MAPTQTWRRLHGPPTDGAWNMAVDEHLLQAAARPDATVTLRTYSWAEPTVSLGYFQSATERPAHLSGLAYVRRQTGGGAILHDRELTYSLVVPGSHALAAMPTTELYDQVHACIATALATFDVHVTPRGECDGPVGAVEAQRGPFLCFERSCAQDLALDGVKVVGSAQRRRPGAVLQHGSILLAASDHEPSLPGVLELCARRLELDPLAEAFADAVARQFGVRWDSRALDEAERLAAEDLCARKYAGAAWNDMK